MIAARRGAKVLASTAARHSTGVTGSGRGCAISIAQPDEPRIGPIDPARRAGGPLRGTAREAKAEPGAMSMERLTAEDRFMLWPDEIWPQDIGALVMLDGGRLIKPDGDFRIEAVREAVASRLHLLPRFRQLLYIPLRRLGGPMWVDAQTIDLADHVATVPVPAPGDETQLLLTVEQLRRRRLDRSRPLWEMWFLTGLPENRVGLFMRMHHAMADGMAALASVERLLDTKADVLPDPPRPWTPAPMPAESDLLRDKRGQQRRQYRDALTDIAHPIAPIRYRLAAWPALRELIADRPLPVTSLHRVVGPDRALALIRGSLQQIKDVAATYNATVNDVLLAVTAGALRGLLSSRGEPIDGVMVRIYVPISMHQEAGAQLRGNLIGQMAVPLPIGIADPVARLQAISRETAQRKKRIRPSLGRMPHGLVGRALLVLVKRQRVNVASTDILGPEVPLYLAGARLLEVFPMVQLLGTVTLAVGGMSYAGQFNAMVVADAQTYPDIDIFTRCAQEELRTLAAESQPLQTSPVTAA
jgi:diacylglycerol O-acyltransferase